MALIFRYTPGGTYDPANSSDLLAADGTLLAGKVPGGPSTTLGFYVEPTGPLSVAYGTLTLYLDLVLGRNQQGNVLVAPGRNLTQTSGGLLLDASDATIGLSLTGGFFGDTLIGGTERDTLIGGVGDDRLEGRDGDDFLVADQFGRDTLVGGAGSDTVFAGGVLDLRAGIVSQPGSDSVVTLIGIENAQGGDGDDLFIPGAAANAIEGGGGVDTVTYAASPAGVVLYYGPAIFFFGGGGDAAGDRLSGVERIIGSRFGDTIALGDVARFVSAGAGDDVVVGSDGNDTLIGGAGADVLLGGAGSDTLSYAEATSGVRVNLSSGSGTAGEARGDTIAGFEVLVGSRFADVLTDGPRNTLVQAGEGNDTVVGVGSTLDGGDGFDTLDLRQREAGVVWNVATGAVRTPAGDVLILPFSFEAARGTDFADTFIASDSVRRFWGQGGADRITGGAGADTLDGGEGDDSLDGGMAADRLAGGAGMDTLTGGEGNDTLSGGADADLLRGDAGRDVLSGDDGSDRLEGGADEDRLSGAAGADTLLGGAGRDALTGGAGPDLLVWSAVVESPASAPDSVADFDAASGDRLDLSALGAVFVGTAALPGEGTPSVGWRPVGSGVLLRADANGDGVADLAVLLKGVTSLAAADLIL